MIKIVAILLIGIGLSTCNKREYVLLKKAQETIDVSPDTCLKYLDSINFTCLSLSQTYDYYYLKYDATFKRDGDLRDFIPILNSPEYWLNHKNKQKAAYNFLYNGIISANMKLFDQAIICINEAKELAIKQQDSLLIFYIHYYEGKLLFQNHEFYESKEAYTKALNYYDLSYIIPPPNDIKKIIMCYWFTDQYDKAIHYFQIFQQKTNTHEDFVISEKTLEKVKYLDEKKRMKRKMTSFLQEYFREDSLSPVYSKIANIELHLFNQDLDSAFIYLNSLPKEILCLMLQHGNNGKTKLNC